MVYNKIIFVVGMSLDESSFGAIAAVNALFGVINFIVLSLPEGWKLVADKIPPDVDRIFRVGDVKWALEGQARSIVVFPEGAAEINVVVVEGRKVKPFGEETLVNGHNGYYRLIRVKRGLLRKRVYDAIEISFYCEETNRTIRISIVSASLTKHLERILRAVSKSLCH